MSTGGHLAGASAAGELHREPRINFDAVLESAKRAFAAKDFDTAQRRLNGAAYIIGRVKRRKAA